MNRCPYTDKKQLVRWASKYFNISERKVDRKYKKNQLYAIYYRIARKAI